MQHSSGGPISDKFAAATREENALTPGFRRPYRRLEPRTGHSRHLQSQFCAYPPIANKLGNRGARGPRLPSLPQVSGPLKTNRKPLQHGGQRNIRLPPILNPASSRMNRASFGDCRRLSVGNGAQTSPARFMNHRAATTGNRQIPWQLAFRYRQVCFARLARALSGRILA
jgi:hypothetical protein